MESGVHMIVCADDIVVYAIDLDPERTHDKLINILTRIVDWRAAHEISIEPAKSAAINFSGYRDPGAPLRLCGTDIAWKSPLKFLGIWFT